MIYFFYCREKSAPLGFQYTLTTTVESDVKEEMTHCLDKWQTDKSNKKKKKSSEKINVDSEAEIKVESLGKGTAVLLPKEGTAEVWNISSEDESEPEVVICESKPATTGINSVLLIS